MEYVFFQKFQKSMCSDWEWEVGYNKKTKEHILWRPQPRFISWLHPLTITSFVSYLTFLGLSFLICEAVMTM